MKNKVLYFLIFFGFSVFSAFAETLPFETESYVYLIYFTDFPNPGYSMSFNNSQIEMEFPELDEVKQENSEFISSVKKESYTLQKEGDFVFLNAFGKTFMVLYYENLICILVDKENNITYFGVNKNSEYVRTPANRIYTRGWWIGVDSRDLNYSSSLRENLKKGSIVYDCRNQYTWQINKPWCEGIDGSCINEFIFKNTMYNTDKILVINGYVNAAHPDYFYKNERAKDVEITTEKNEYSVCLKDTPQIQAITLSETEKGKIKLTIKSVYEGLKHTDTCISGFYFLLPVPKR